MRAYLRHSLVNRRVAVVVIAGAAAAALSFSIATAIGANGATDTTSLHKGGPVTERVLVARGSTAGWGDWELYRSTDADGRECKALKVLAEDLMYEGCGGGADMQVASLIGKTDTLLVGRVPADATTAQLVVPGRATQTIDLLPAAKGIPNRFFVALAQGRPHGGVVNAMNSAGREVGAESLVDG